MYVYKLKKFITLYKYYEFTYPNCSINIVSVTKPCSVFEAWVKIVVSSILNSPGIDCTIYFPLPNLCTTNLKVYITRKYFYGTEERIHNLQNPYAKDANGFFPEPRSPKVKIHNVFTFFQNTINIHHCTVS